MDNDFVIKSLQCCCNSYLHQVTLPKSVVVVNGSGSHDDLKIVKYLWTRMPGSLAAGKILGSSNTEPALLLVNLVPGLYVFQLQVLYFIHLYQTSTYTHTRFHEF